MPLPPWLNVQPADFLRATEAGTHVQLQRQQMANQAAQATARLNHEQMIAQMEAESRKQITQQNALMRQAQIEFQKQYHDSQVGLARQRMEEMQAINQAKAQDAARKFAAQQKYTNLLRSGVSPDQALYQVPELATPSAVAAINRGGQKEYGPIETQEVAPGVTAAFRKGSPSIHFMPEAKMNARQKVIDQDLKKQYDKLSSQLTGYDPKTDDTIKMQMQQIEQQRLQNAYAGGGTSTGTASPFKEGQKIRNKKDGKIYVIKDGVPVPVDQQSEQGQDETVVPEQ